MNPVSGKKKKEGNETHTFAIRQGEDLQAPESLSNHGKIVVGDAGEEGPGRRLGHVQLQHPREPKGHLPQHERPRPHTQLPPPGALHGQPPLADQREAAPVPISLQPLKYRPQLVVPQHIVNAQLRLPLRHVNTPT